MCLYTGCVFIFFVCSGGYHNKMLGAVVTSKIQSFWTCADAIMERRFDEVFVLNIWETNIITYG